MSRFEPIQAAKLADDVYALTKIDTLEEAMLILNSKYNGVFAFADNNMLKGKTGGPGFIKCRTAFGFCLIGQGAYKGQAVMLFRGTQYLADWLTNLNVSVSSSSSGRSIHDGFNKSFKSMEAQLMHFMGVLISHNIHTFHCVGHSLGGALATICADWLKTTYGRKPYLYSYGSPRVGLQSFAAFCTSSIGADRIYRAYHKTDIVPCIPTFPFYHTPVSGTDYYLPSPGMIPMAEYHGMDKYIDSVDGKTWEELAGLRAESKNETSIAQWLKEEGVVGVTVTALGWLHQALIFVLKKCMQGAEWLALKAFGNNFTFMDQLSYILMKGINVVEEASSWVLYLIKKIMHILGMVASVKVEDLNVAFIRGVLMHLQQRVNNFTKQALSKTLVDGRAI